MKMETDKISENIEKVLEDAKPIAKGIIEIKKELRTLVEAHQAIKDRRLIREEDEKHTEEKKKQFKDFRAVILMVVEF